MKLKICSPFEVRLSSPGPKTRNSTKNKENLYKQQNRNNIKGHTNNVHATYMQDKLMTAGDIEKHPGPRKRTEPCTHILSLLMLLVIILNKIGAVEDLTRHKFEPSSKSPKALEQSLNNLSNLLAIRYKKMNISIKLSKNSSSAHIVMLLIMAGDIHPEPGPVYETKCLKCNQHRTNQDETAVTCETCKGWCHLNCSAPQNNNADSILNKSFEWICPNHTCQPNHHVGTGNTLQQTTNRFKLLNSAKPPATRRKPIYKNKKSHSKSPQNLLKHLPKITATAYEGKDICKACHKIVTKPQKAISCDSCEGWTHLKCSDMSAKKYNDNAGKIFPWICNMDRETEVPITVKVDLKLLKPDQLPISNSELLQRSDDSLLILHYNCRSSTNKEAEIYNICQELDPAILCLTETWLDESTKQTSYVPDGYKIIRQDRSESFKQKFGKNNGGGIAIIHKEELKIQKLNFHDEMEETLWVEIKTNPSLILCTVYRASYTKLLTENENGSILEAQLNEAAAISNRIMAIGDFNCDTASEKLDKNTATLIELFDAHSLKQLITKPTRIDLETNKATTIDHIWVEPETNIVKESGTIEGISDHVGIYVKANLTKPKPEKQIVRFRSYKNYSPENFNNDLKQALVNSSLQTFIDEEKVNEATELWVKIFSDTANKHAPIIEKERSKKKKNIPWFNRSLETLISERTKKLKLYRLYGMWTDLKLVKTITNNITHLKRRLKKAYYTDKIEKYDGDPKNIWKILKDVTHTQNKKSTTEPEFINQDVTNKFNKFFATVGSEIQKKLKIADASPVNTGTQKFELMQENEDTIIKLIDRIRTDVAVGSDDINAKLIKDSKHIISNSLMQLINISYKTSVFPSCMKKAIVKAIHKKESTEDPSNYRPLSILSVVSKIFERSATDQLVQYLEVNNLLTPLQHAYRKGHSTQTCLNEIVDYIYKENDKGNTVGIASLDLSKAFDSINHSHLLQKLITLGLGETSLEWCKSYLTDRTQQTKFKNFISTTETVTSGVPQGSILGPILFICFVNDLPEQFENCKIISYADDTQILVSAKSTKEIKLRLENLIQTAQKWYNRNSLLNNASKTEIMLISKRKNKETFEINITDSGKQKKLKLKKSIKVLGVHLDEELNWNKHTSQVNRRARYATRNLQRTNHLIPFKSRLLLYNCLVACHFNYSDTVWGGCSTKNKNKLQRTQNAAIKSIMGLKPRDSSSQALGKANLLNLEQKRKVHEAVYVHKALAGKLPQLTCQQYQQHQSLKNYRSAEKQILSIPKHKTENYKNSPLYRTITTWNSIPHSIKKTETSTFKKNCQSHLQKMLAP